LLEVVAVPPFESKFVVMDDRASHLSGEG
jgi:hypothetical protein